MIKGFKEKLDKDIHLNELLTGSILTFILKLLGMLLSYIVILVISRFYGAEGIGLYTLSLTIMTFMVMISTMGIQLSVLRFVGHINNNKDYFKLRQLYKNINSIVIPTSILLSAFLFLFSEKLALSIFENPNYEDAIKLVALILPFMTIQNISVEFIRGLKKIKISESLRSIVRPAIIILVIFLIVPRCPENILVPVYAFGFSVIISALLSSIYINKQLKHVSISNVVDELTKRKLLKISLPMMITSLSAFAMGNVSIIMLEMFTTTEEVGIYSVCLKLAMSISLVLVVVNTISAPKFSELYWNKKYTQLQKMLNQSAKLILFPSLVFALILFILPETILSLFGKEFLSGKYVLILLIIGQLVNAATGSVGIFLNMTGHQNVMRNVTVIAFFITLLSSYILIPTYRMEGAALSVVLGTLVINLIPAIYAHVKLNYCTYYSPFHRNNK